MALVKKIGKQHCVVHGTTGKVLVRAGKRVCFTTRAKATTEARRTRCRVTGRCK